VSRRASVIATVVLTVVAVACGSGDSILDAGNPATSPRPTAGSTAPPTASTSLPISSVAGQTTRPGARTTAPAAPTTAQPATTRPAPTTTTTPLDALPPCPVDALGAVGGTVRLTLWHGMTGALEDALTALTDTYNASQSKVKVSLENQGGYDQTIDK
jgi:ABC-type glycerol-3-phosphate transport system substrate-binding protein